MTPGQSAYSAVVIGSKCGVNCQMGSGPDCKSGVYDSRVSTPRHPTTFARLLARPTSDQEELDRGPGDLFR